ncbi:hypothetical protein B6S44_27215 [Bosea sp. Tri-44]|uniref:WG repeat-containing protein n=1 Tax=Bosea sp. Tri-44 TaxID=1972137 RepID=UPI00100E0A40|nr:WG repeat-containing protein [Bosea sp. Tri-44]RXT46490.1 hypothetical protein B6S44_27215 [Bosea sp. Tri-44]
MPRSICIALFALVVWFYAGPEALAQSRSAKWMSSCGGTFDLCGFVDHETKAEVIPRRFERAFPFSEGLASVRIEGRFGFIDETGTVVIPAQFDLAGEFHRGHAEVLIDGKMGAIDRRGILVIQPQFARVIPFTSDVFLVREGTWTSGYLEGFEKLESLSFGFISGQGAFGLFSLSSGWIAKPQYGIQQFDRGKSGLIWASRDRIFGLLRADGRWQIEPRYVHVQALSDERAIVCEPEQGKGETRQCGAIDPDGNLVVPMRAWWLHYWRNGFGLAREGGKEGLLDRAGNVIGGQLFDKVERPERGDVAEVLLDGKWVGLGRDGRIVANPKDGQVIAACPSGVRLLWQDGKVQVMGRDSRPTVPHLLDYTYNKLYCDKPSPVKLGAKWGFVGVDGLVLNGTPAFDNIYGFGNGFAAVAQGGKWGVIDTTGRHVIEPRYDQLTPADGTELLKAKEAGREFWINARGEEQPAPVRKVDRAAFLRCGGDGATIKADTAPDGSRVWGIVDADGRELIKREYRAIHCFRNGVAWVPVDSKRQWCPLGQERTARERPRCTESRYPYLQTHSSPERFSDDAYENSVQWSRAYLEFGADLRTDPPRMIPERGAASFSIMR